jgi:hypothetical protein
MSHIAQTCRIQWVSTIWTQIVGTDLQHSGSTQDGVNQMSTACSFTHRCHIQWIHTAASQFDCFGWTIHVTLQWQVAYCGPVLSGPNSMRYIHTEVEINACTFPLMENACTFTNAYQLQWNLSGSMLSQHIWVNNACNMAQTCQIQWSALSGPN